MKVVLTKCYSKSTTKDEISAARDYIGSKGELVKRDPVIFVPDDKYLGEGFISGKVLSVEGVFGMEKIITEKEIYYFTPCFQN